MKIGEYLTNYSTGELIGFKYENGFVFKGEFDQNKNPFYGDIYLESQIIYHGQIVGDIFSYFNEYTETGHVKQRHPL